MAGFIVINQQQIPWSFVMKVRKILGGDIDRTMDCFYKARHAAPPNGVVRYIAAGFRPDDNGNRYSMLPSTTRENEGMRPIRAWWESVYPRKARTDATRDILRSIVQEGVE